MNRAESMGEERAMMEGLEERRMMSVGALASIPDGTSNITDGTSNTIVFGAVRGGASGRITGIAVDPSDPSGNTLYVGAANGGVWKTTNF
jgi:hypothetical protein